MRDDTKNIKKRIVSGLIASPDKINIKKTYNGFYAEMRYRKNIYKITIFDTLYGKYVILDIDSLCKICSTDLEITIERINSHIKARYKV